MKKYYLLPVLMFLISFNLAAQTFIGATGNLPFRSCGNFPATVSGVAAASRFKSITFSITHPHDSDLDIYLIAPNGTSVGVSIENGGAGRNYINTVIDINATNSINFGYAPFTGIYRSEVSLSPFNGIGLNGTWNLKVCNGQGGIGALTDWSITFESTVPPDAISMQPPTASIVLGNETIISGQIKKTGLTDTTSGQAPGIESWVGYSTTNTDPAGWTNWIPAVYHQEVGDNDEYQLPFGATITPPGTYYYAMRYRISGSSMYFYVGTNNGLWNGSTHNNGVLMINPAPIPSNNNCSGAIPLTVNPGYVCSTTTHGTVAGATQSPVDANVCGGIEDDDVWFSFVATATTQVVTITDVRGSTMDLYHSLWTGTDCNSLGLVAGSCSDGDMKILSSLEPGRTYYLRIYTTVSTPYQSTSFNVCITAMAPVPDAVSLHSPSDAAIDLGSSITVYGRIIEAGLTDVTSGQAPNIRVWVGYTNRRIEYTNPVNSNSNYIWIPATFNQEDGNSDEYKVTFGSELPNGKYYFVTRFQIGNGEYFYGGINNAGEGNFWNETWHPAGRLRIRPSNYTCANAFPLTVGNTFDEHAVIGSMFGATEDYPMDINCNGSQMVVNSRVYYKAVIPDSGSIAVETKSAATNLTYDVDTVLVASIGDCNQLIGLGCNDNRYPDNYSRIILFNQTPGDILTITLYKPTIYAPQYNYHEFKISAYNATLATDTFDDAAFSYSPNPVTDVLHLSYSKEITTVVVFDAMGRKVYGTNHLPNETTIDMASLTRGIYMVLITSDSQSKTIKIMKE